MRRNKYIKGNPQLRQMLIREAARLMYEEGVDQYHDAKRLAAKRLLGRGQRGSFQPRTADLPSNGEISLEIATLARFHEGDSHDHRLFLMRVTALEVMLQLSDYSPRLIGSVSTGRVRQGSDIDLHVFTDNIETLCVYLNTLGLAYEQKQVTIRKGSVFVEYTHIYLDQSFPVELSVYPSMELRIRGRSSTDGKPIVRVSADRLLELLLEEHGEAWGRYLQDGADFTSATART